MAYWSGGLQHGILMRQISWATCCAGSNLPGLEPVITGVNIKQRFQKYKSWNLSYLLQILVRHIDLSWNTIEPSLVLMYGKLVELDFVYYDGRIQIIEPETEGSDYHEANPPTPYS
jgi:hypothetical protein